MPMVGTMITATLTDDDGMVSGQTWQWEKSMTPTDMASWMDATGMGATTMSYTPVAMDEGYHLRATVMYTDKDRSGRMAYSMATANAVTAEPASDEDRLLAEYDANNNSRIDAEELNTAIGHYLAGTLVPADMNILIGLFLGG